MKFLRLRKSADEINFEKDLMEAGKSKGKKDKVSEEQLEMGKEVEKEHTINPEIAEKITRDHLEEIPDYYTHLKKMEDAVKKESAIQQPNKPKPTTTLPDNMEWSWDPNAADWVAVMKNNTNVTPPLYNPQNQNVVNQNTTSYMSTVKSASCLEKFLDGPRYNKEIKIEAGLIKDGLVKYAGFDFNKGSKYAITEKGLEVLRKASEQEHNEALNEREKLAYLFGFNTDKETTLDTTGKVIESDGVKKFNVKSLINKLYNEIKKSRKHWEGIDPLEYTHIDAKNVDGGIEIEVRDELSYEGMEKLAELLNKTIQEIDSQAYFEQLEPGIMIAFISDGSNIHASLNKFAKKYTICEADGTELGEVEALDEIDAKVKFGIEHPEYADSQSIKVICADLNNAGSFEYHNYKVDLFRDTDGGATFVIYTPNGKKVNHETMYKGTASNMDEAITKAYNIIDDESKVVTSQYEQTTEQHLDYPNPSETPVTDTIIENHTGWVNTAEQKVTPEFAKLHSILGEYRKQDKIQDIIQDGKDLLITCSPATSFELKEQIESLGYECEETDESETGDVYTLPTFVLRIKMK